MLNREVSRVLKHRSKFKMRIIAGTAALLGFATSAIAGSPATVQQIMHSSQTIAGQPLTLPQGKVEVSASIFTIEPGASLPVHRHAFPRYGYVLTGQLDVINLETGRITHFNAGDFVVESVSKWHSGSNPGKDPLKLLVVDQAPSGAQTTELKQ
jgi:quercetin dioxygenase-like cupin family protein